MCVEKDWSTIIYIVDAGNNRIQKWNRGASSGITIVRSPIGVTDNNAIQDAVFLLIVLLILMRLEYMSLIRHNR